MRMRKKKNLLHRMEACRACQVQDPFAMRGHWRELMPDARELRVELGCGKGRFTVGTAQAEPDVLLIAVEKVPDAMVVAMERAQAAGLHNVFFVVGDAALLPDMFAPAEVDRLYINFCDPWPKSNQKFYELGKNINRCVATMEPWTEPEEEPAEAAPVEASSEE